MATTSEVKKALDEIASVIAAQEAVITKAQTNAAAASAALAAIPTDFSDVIATINAYSPTGAFETLAKDEKAKLQTEFRALKAKADAIVSQS